MLNITEKGGANVEELVRDSILPSVDEVGIILPQRSPKDMNKKILETSDIIGLILALLSNICKNHYPFFLRFSSGFR